MIVCRIGFPGERKKNALNYKRRKIFFVHPKLNRMKEEWHANSFENIWLSSKNLADFNFHYFTAIKQQTKQVSFPSISGPSPLYLGAGAFLCLSHNRLFTPLAKKARDKLRGFKEWGFCLLLLCYITQGMLIFIRAFMSQLVMAHVTALPTPVSLQSDLSNIFFFLRCTYIGPADSSSAARIQVQSREDKGRKEKRVSLCTAASPTANSKPIYLQH